MDSLFDSLVDDLVAQVEPICSQIESLPLVERIEALNRVRSMLHQVSPFVDEPVDNVQWLDADRVVENGYNPNQMAPPEFRLLAHSIRKNGVTQPVVGWRVSDQDVEIVDGEHRTKVIKKNGPIRRRLHGYVPVSVVNEEITGENDRIAATIDHNRARGVHGILPMGDIVAMLIRNGWNDDQIAKELGMSADEVLRFKQNVGLPELFQDHEYGHAWE